MMGVIEELVQGRGLCTDVHAGGVAEDALVEFERRYAVSLPKDFRSYFLLANGGETNDESFVRFWPLEEVVPVEVELADYAPDRDLYPGAFVFADFAINAWLWAIQLGGDPGDVGRVFLLEVDGRRKPPIVQSFTEWVRCFLVNSHSLGPGGVPGDPGPPQSIKPGRRPWWRFW